MDDVIKKLNDGTHSVDEVSDEDIRQLVIYYATVVRGYAALNGTGPSSASQTGQAILNAWDNMPRELWSRFSNMILSNSGAGTKTEDQFWVRPAETNIKFGVKLYVEPVEVAACHTDNDNKHK